MSVSCFFPTMQMGYPLYACATSPARHRRWHRRLSRALFGTGQRRLARTRQRWRTTPGHDLTTAVVTAGGRWVGDLGKS